MTDYNSYNQQQYSSPQGNNQAPNYQNNQGPPPGNYQAPNTYQNNLGTPQNYGYSQQNMQKGGDNYYNLEFERSQQLKQGQKQPLNHLDEGLVGSARKKFIAKVYIILGIQFLITAGMCFASYYSQAFFDFQLYNSWMGWVCLAFALITQIAIFCCPIGRQHPYNFILLVIFTICQSYGISLLCTVVADTNGTPVVVVAAIMTFAIVFSLSLYAIFTKEDFTTKWGILIVLLVAMLILGIVSIFAWSPFLDNLYCCLGVIVFGIYLVIDTQLIIGGRKMKLSMDDYIIGALILYIDIIQIFLYLLELLSKK